MGLGPPVCKDCMKLAKYIDKKPYWYCDCGNEHTIQDSTISNLWCYSKEDQEKILRNSK